MQLENSCINGEWREAAFSECGRYRYRLDITFDIDMPKTLVTICLNPSTATHLKDDATFRRCKGFAKQLGCGSYRMLNLFAYRSTDYRALFRVHDPIGPENTLEYLRRWTADAIVVAAWGAHVTERIWRYYRRGDEVLATIPGVLCWDLTGSGAPRHPLYLPSSSVLKPIPV